MVQYHCSVAGCTRTFDDGHNLADHLTFDHDGKPLAFSGEVNFNV